MIARSPRGWRAVAIVAVCMTAPSAAQAKCAISAEGLVCLAKPFEVLAHVQLLSFWKAGNDAYPTVARARVLRTLRGSLDHELLHLRMDATCSARPSFARVEVGAEWIVALTRDSQMLGQDEWLISTLPGLVVPVKADAVVVGLDCAANVQSVSIQDLKQALNNDKPGCDCPGPVYY